MAKKRTKTRTRGGRTAARSKARTAPRRPPARRGKRKPTDLGTNRTGVRTSPLLTRMMAESTEAVPGDPSLGAALAAARAAVSEEAPPIGTMPIPGSLKGLAKSLGKALQGEKAAVLLDKLGERLAFERTGVRLYEAVLAKLPASRLEKGSLTAQEVRRFRDEEHRHLHLVREALETMGGDPTAVTPCADLAGVQATGLVATVTDPRTTLTQCLGAILTAELADNDGWKLLIALTEAAGQPELAERFTAALAEEDHHLASVRAWLAERLGVQLGARLPSAELGEPARPE